MKNTDKYEITVLNKQTIDESTDIIKENAHGGYIQKNGKIHIRYKTTSDDSEVITLITIDRDTVTIKRGVSAMVYKKGKKTNIQYNTPYGVIPMEIETTKLNASFNELGGTLELCYSISMRQDKYFNDILIKVTER